MVDGALRDAAHIRELVGLPCWSGGVQGAPAGAPAAGSGTAKYLLVDHFISGSSGTLWAYDGRRWRAVTSLAADESGIEQVAFAPIAPISGGAAATPSPVSAAGSICSATHVLVGGSGC